MDDRLIQFYYRTTIKQWFCEELESFRAQGADEESLKDPTLRTLIFQISLHKHHDEIQADEDLFDAVFLELFELAPADYLREMAADFRDRGVFDTIEDLEWLADLKERGELPPELTEASFLTCCCR